MRIPWSRIYRAFPELDRFSNEECERFMVLARRREWLWEIAVGALALVALAGVYMLVYNVWRAAPALLPPGVHAYIWRSPMLIAALGALSLLSGPLAALMIRDAWIRRAIGRNIDLSRCIGCGYSLLGLPVEGGVAVRCPECGRISTLAEMRLTAEQLMPGAGSTSAAPGSAGPSGDRR